MSEPTTATEPTSVDENLLPKAQASKRRRLWLMCGESSVASIGIALSMIVLAVLAACAYWMMHTQSQTLELARREQIVSTAQLLAQSSQRMLAVGEMTPVRGLVMDTANRLAVDRLRITLPSGDVIVDSHPDHITADLATAIWQASDGASETAIENNGQSLTVRIPMDIHGRGVAQLEVVAPLNDNAQSFWEAQAGMGTIGITALLALWLVYRHFRHRLAAMGVIRESLLAMSGGEQSETALAVAGHLGREATTWNQMLAERQQFRKHVAVRQTKERLGDRRTNNGDLACGCDAMSQGVILLDDHLRVTYMNNAAAVFLGGERMEILGSPVIDWVRDADLSQVILESVTQKNRAMHMLDRRSEGGAGVIRYTVRQVRESDSASALLMIEDVTQQRVAEEARHQFVAQATHELRTPLTNIRLYLETAIDDGDKDPTLRSKCLNIINQETFRLEQLVGDMLSVAEIESGSLHISHDDVRIDKMINDIQVEYQAQATEKDLKLEFNIPPKLPVLQGDRGKLIIAVQNLVGNALKYTSDGGRVSVSVEVSDTELTIEVSDTGIGIAPEHQLQVFDKFYRAEDKRVTGIAGSGLGLALAREIARLHSGDIVLQSQIDQGSTFTLTLPIPEHAETTATE